MTAPILLGISTVLCNNTNMGKLTPGIPLIYERANGQIYAREFGKFERTVVGCDTDSAPTKHHQLSKWNEILLKSESDPALKEMINQIEVYHALKNTP